MEIENNIEKKRILSLAKKMNEICDVNGNYEDQVNDFGECLEELRKIASERSQLINVLNPFRSKNKGMYGCKYTLNNNFGVDGKKRKNLSDKKLLGIGKEILKKIQNTKKSVLNGNFEKALEHVLYFLPKAKKRYITELQLENVNYLNSIYKGLNEQQKENIMKALQENVKKLENLTK